MIDKVVDMVGSVDTVLDEAKMEEFVVDTA